MYNFLKWGFRIFQQFYCIMYCTCFGIISYTHFESGSNKKKLIAGSTLYSKSACAILHRMLLTSTLRPKTENGSGFGLLTITRSTFPRRAKN